MGFSLRGGDVLVPCPDLGADAGMLLRLPPFVGEVLGPLSFCLSLGFTLVERRHVRDSFERSAPLSAEDDFGHQVIQVVIRV